MEHQSTENLLATLPMDIRNVIGEFYCLLLLEEGKAGCNKRDQFSPRACVVRNSLKQYYWRPMCFLLSKNHIKVWILVSYPA